MPQKSKKESGTKKEVKDNSKKKKKQLIRFLKSDKEIIKKSELEEIKETEIINDNEFREFLRPIKGATSPVLEEIARGEEVGGKIFFTPGMDTRIQDDEKAFRYDAQAQESNEPKYQDYSSVRQNLEILDTTKIRRDIGETHISKLGITSSIEKQDSLSLEKYVSPNRIDTNQLGRENPFEKKLPEAERKKEYTTK